MEQAPPAPEFAPAVPDTGPSSRGTWWWVPGAITVITIASVIVVTLSQLHPSMLLTNTTTTGGDTGAHIAMPKFLESLLAHGHLTGWDPGWYDGFPLYTFYFTIPDLFIAIGGWIIPYGVAFKLGTILGSVILPICAWACGRFFRLRAPLPTILAAATLPFLFDYTFTIYGGNLFSTLAGEYAYSFSLSLAVLFLGLFACAVREGKYRGWAAIVLAVCILSHMVGGMYALGGAVILTVVELLPARWGIADSALHLWRGDDTAVQVPRTRILWWACSTVAIGLLLSGWWLVPFGLEHAYSSSMGYTNVEGWAQYFREADAWALVLAGIGAITAVVTRSRFGITVTVLGIAFALATAVGPAGQPLQRPPAAVVVHLGVPDGGLGVRDLVRHCGDGVAPGAGPSLAGSRRDWVVRRAGALSPLGPARLLGWVHARGRSCSLGATAVAATTAAAPPALGTGRGERRHPRAPRCDGGGGAALHPSCVCAAGDDRAERGHELVELQLRGLPGPDLLPRVPLPHADDERPRPALWLWSCDVGVQREREPLRHARGADAAALRDERVHRFDGGPPLRVLRHDAVPLPQSGGAVGGTVRARGRSPLRRAQRDARACSTCSCSA